MNNLLELKGVEAVKQKINNELSTYVLKEIKDEDDVKLAKGQRASLVKLSGALDTERKRLSKEMKTTIDNLITSITKPINDIDTMLEEYELKFKDERLYNIVTLFETLPSKLSFEEIYEESWLNKTCNWKKEVTEKIDKVNNELEIIVTISSDKRLFKCYLDCFDIVQAKKEFDEMLKEEEDSNLIKKIQEEAKLQETKKFVQTSIFPNEDMVIEKTYTSYGISFKCDENTFNRIKKFIETVASDVVASKL